MLFDKEGHAIKLADRPNPNILSVGNSGYGKTYFNCGKMREYADEGKICLVIDYSGSYREAELEKNGMKPEEMIIYNPCVHPFYFMVHVESERKLVKNIVDTFVNIWGISSYNQKTLLEQAVAETLSEFGSLNFGALFECLKEMAESEKNKEKGKERTENINRLLMRMDIYADISNIYIKRSTVMVRKKKNNLQILQLSDFPEQQRNFLSEFFITMLWKEVTDCGASRYDVVFLDEFQHLSMAKDGALYGILREGRKYGLAVVLSTQFISQYTPGEQDALMQCGNILFFKPTARDKRLCADLIDKDNRAVWERVLENLGIGEVIIKGNFIFSSRSKVMTRPLLCEVN